MNGFNDHIKTMILTRKAKTLNDIIQAAQAAKCLEEQHLTDSVLIAIQEVVALLEASTDIIKKHDDSAQNSPETTT